MATAGTLLCLSYCVGLFCTSLLLYHWGLDPLMGALISGLGSLVAGLVAAVIMPRRWPLGPSSPVWLMAGIIAVFATLNYWWRLPVPAVDDVSQLLGGDQARTEMVVWGTAESAPELTRSGRRRLWLRVEQVQPQGDGSQAGSPEAASGRLYVTLDAERAADVYPGQTIRLGGNLYAPSLPKNPSDFDFQAYLASHGAFAGFSADWLRAESDTDEPGWGLWQLRQRIAAAHIQGMGESTGPLVSAMALGRKAVDLPYPLQDSFIKAGLAHTLAASGFHVSLVLAVVLGLCRSQSPSFKVAAGAIALITYVGLTGAQPSVMRAALMGGGALVGLALERQVKPLGCLLVAVTVLLAGNPHWIDSIGFRLSVIATLGLMVSVQPISRRLEFLPETLAAPLAVPIAAYLWTLPLQLYYFNVLSTYSIAVNLVVTPLVTVISLGGIATGLVAVVWPWLAGLLAWPLQFPAWLLMALVQWQVNLPGSSLAMGQISLAQMLGIYGLLLLGWLQPWCQQRRWLVGCLALSLACGPLWWATETQAAVLAAGDEPILVLQDQRRSLLVNSGDAKTAFYTINPFLRQAGTNSLAWAVALPDNTAQAWQVITDQTPVEVMYSSHTYVEAGVASFEALQPQQSQPMGRTTLQNLGAENPILRLVLPDKSTWLRLPSLSPELQRHLAQVVTTLESQVLWWDGRPVTEELLEAVQPTVAIASSRFLDPAVEVAFQDRGIQVFWTERDGAVLWSPKQGFRSYLSSRSQPGPGEA